MGRAIRTVEETMAAVTPLVVPGATMAELAESVEHELLAAGSRTTSFATHIFTGLGDGELDSTTETAHEPMREETSVMFDFGGVVDGYCSDFGARSSAALLRTTTARPTRSCSPPTRPVVPPLPPARKRPT